MNGRTAIDRVAETIQHAAEQARANAQKRIVLAGNHAIAGLQTIDLVQGKREHAVISKSDHLSPNGTPRGGSHLAEVADRGHRSARGDQQPYHLGDLADPRQQFDIRDPWNQTFHR